MIKTLQRRVILLKTAALVIAPLFTAGILIVLNFIEVPANPFARGEEYRFSYVKKGNALQKPARSLILDIGRTGYTSISSGETVLWHAKMSREGKYQPELFGPLYYSIFWLPVPHSFPVFNVSLKRELNESPMMDVTGFLGEPGETYKFRTGKYRPEWRTGGLSRAKRSIRFIDEHDVVAGTGDYDPATGVLLHAVSYAGQGSILSLQGSDFPGSKASDLMLVLVLLMASGLAFYELFKGAILEPRRKRDGSDHLDFAILGYTIVLVDIFYDLSYYHGMGDLALICVHIGLIVFIWSRLGWWALLPVLELFVAAYYHFLNGSLQPAFALFPASLSAWLLAMLIQKQISPPSLSWIREMAEEARGRRRPKGF